MAKFVRMVGAICLCVTMSIGALAGDRGEPRGKVAVDLEKFDGLTDKEFVRMAAQGDFFEIALGKVAMERASSPAVKKFAQKMIDDHSKSSAKLKSVVVKAGLTLPTEYDAKHKEMAKDLLAKKGAEFDQAYANAMVKDHQKALALYKHQAKNGKHAELREFAAKTVPIIEGHLKMATDLARDTGKATGSGKVIRDGDR